jgi:hypothetical protein
MSEILALNYENKYAFLILFINYSVL